MMMIAGRAGKRTGQRNAMRQAGDSNFGVL
jgi:hypothetical protein